MEYLVAIFFFVAFFCYCYAFWATNNLLIRTLAAIFAPILALAYGAVMRDLGIFLLASFPNSLFLFLPIIGSALLGYYAAEQKNKTK